MAEQAVLLDVKTTEPKKLNRHVSVALSHLNKRRGALLQKRSILTKEIEELDAAILVLE